MVIEFVSLPEKNRNYNMRGLAKCPHGKGRATMDGLNKSNRRMKYTRQSIVSNTFYQMPRFLTASEFAGNKISNNARFLYTLLLDRHKLSVKNDWVDENGEVYIYFKREEMEIQLGISDRTISKVMQELKDLLLVEEKKQGLNRPNKIYLLFPVIGNDEKPDLYLEPDFDYNPENPYEHGYDAEDEIITASEAKDLRVRTRNNFASGNEKNALAGGENSSVQDPKELRPSNNKINKTEKKNNNLSKTEGSKTAATANGNAGIDTAAAEPENPNQSNESILYSQILKMYNKVCETCGLRPIRSIDGKRKTQTAARLKEYGFDGFVDLFGKTSASVFLCGGGERGWKADFDWLIAPTNMQKVLEGKYDNDQSNTPLPQMQAEESYQSPLYSTTTQKNNRERHDPFLERAMTAYATAANAIQTTN